MNLVVNTLPVVVTVVRQIMRELKGATSEKAKIIATTNIVYNSLQEDDK
jgi:hypothetical protein